MAYYVAVPLDSVDSTLAHYGVKRRSGRYPWGSGDTPFQRSGDFLSRVMELESQGFTQKEIADAVYVDNTTDLRIYRRIAAHERQDVLRAKARSLRDDGHSLQEIADIMGYKNDSSVRTLLNPDTTARKNAGRSTANALKQIIDQKGMVDIGAGVELELGISSETLQEAQYILQGEYGYNVYGLSVGQATNPGKRTNIKVITGPDVTYGEAYKNLDNVESVMDYKPREFHSADGGKTFDKLEYPAAISSDRVYIRYPDEGGKEMDGVLQIRRGVADLSLGDSHYAQVRILVDGTNYLKGMAIYSDNIPDGYDIVCNTSKPRDAARDRIIKPISTDDPKNPFGALIMAGGQNHYTDENGERKLGAINKLKQEGDWHEMSVSLSSQFLSKQPLKTVQRQLDLSYAEREAELAEIMSLTNPTIRKKMLYDFADDCDGAAVHLKAVGMPRQRTQVILPLTDIKENEVFAPNFNDGEQVALIRYPHAGRFEIPILTVNNKNKQGKSDITMNAKDAIGIHPSVAERLSGADFDGDTVVVIPQSSKTRVMNAKPLKDLENFDPHVEYAYREGMRVMQKSDIQKEMGMISNLINDMTLRGAPESEIARAVKHSMVVIDANKHKLDYKRSEVENGISELKDRWQRSTTEDGEEKTGGASTIISRRKQSVYIPERQGSGRIDKETGEIIYKESGRLYLGDKGKKYADKLVEEEIRKESRLLDPERAADLENIRRQSYAKAEEAGLTGKKAKAYADNLVEEAIRKESRLLDPDREVDLKRVKRGAYEKAREAGYEEPAQEKIPIMSAVKDARVLSSGHPIEEEYADYANKLKAMANRARKEYANTKDNPKDSAAAAEYDEEVKSIKAKIAVAATNAPRERRAQILANAYVHQITQEHPELLDKNHKKELRRIKQRAIADARDQVGAKGKDTRVDISDREWEAISKNAIAGSTLNELMRYADADKLRERAMPKATTVVSSAKVAQIKALSANGFSNADIAERTGLSISTIHDYVSG